MYQNIFMAIIKIQESRMGEYFTVKKNKNKNKILIVTIFLQRKSKNNKSWATTQRVIAQVMANRNSSIFGSLLSGFGFGPWLFISLFSFFVCLFSLFYSPFY